MIWFQNKRNCDGTRAPPSSHLTLGAGFAPGVFEATGSLCLAGLHPPEPTSEPL